MENENEESDVIDEVAKSHSPAEGYLVSLSNIGIFSRGHADLTTATTATKVNQKGPDDRSPVRKTWKSLGKHCSVHSLWWTKELFMSYTVWARLSPVLAMV